MSSNHTLAGRVNLLQDTTVATQTVVVVTTPVTNAGLVLSPNGTGAIMAQIPDGGTTGGNARGNYAVDFQMERTSNSQVASGPNSALIGGKNNTVTGSNSGVFCGTGSSATGNEAVTIGASNSGASGLRSGILAGVGLNTGGNFAGIVGGGNSSINGVSAFMGGGTSNFIAPGSWYSTVLGGTNNYLEGFRNTVLGGDWVRTYLECMISSGNGKFSTTGDAQYSSTICRKNVVGTAQDELFLNGSFNRLFLSLAAPGPLNGRAWRAQINLVAIVQNAGTGTLTIGECFMGNYLVGIKRIGATTSLVGAVTTLNEVSDTNMATSVVTIDADAGNNALRIRFTPPSGGTSSATSSINVVASIYFTEVGY